MAICSICGGKLTMTMFLTMPPQEQIICTACGAMKVIKHQYDDEIVIDMSGNEKITP